MNRRTPASLTEAANQRLLAVPVEPLAVAEWYRPLFLNYEVDPDVVRKHLPRPFELELWNGRAIVSFVALTTSHFRRAKTAPLWAGFLRLLPEQRFFNVRTYVRHRGEPGAFFFWSWLSCPSHLPLPDRPFGLTCGFAESTYQHKHESGELRGVVTTKLDRERFAYKVRVAPGKLFVPCPPCSLAEFALERYTGYFWRRGAGRVVRAWHLPWQQTVVDAAIEEDGLVKRILPWLREARLIEAIYSPGFTDVWIGRPHLLSTATRSERRPRHGASSFFGLP